MNGQEVLSPEDRLKQTFAKLEEIDRNNQYQAAFTKIRDTYIGQPSPGITAEMEQATDAAIQSVDYDDIKEKLFEDAARVRSGKSIYDKSFQFVVQNQLPWWEGFLPESFQSEVVAPQAPSNAMGRIVHKTGEALVGGLTGGLLGGMDPQYVKRIGKDAMAGAELPEGMTPEEAEEWASVGVAAGYQSLLNPQSKPEAWLTTPLETAGGIYGFILGPGKLIKGVGLGFKALAGAAAMTEKGVKGAEAAGRILGGGVTGAVPELAKLLEPSPAEQKINERGGPGAQEVQVGTKFLGGALNWAIFEALTHGAYRHLPPKMKLALNDQGQLVPRLAHPFRESLLKGPLVTFGAVKAGAYGAEALEQALSPKDVSQMVGMLKDLANDRVDPGKIVSSSWTDTFGELGGFILVSGLSGPFHKLFPGGEKVGELYAAAVEKARGQMGKELEPMVAARSSELEAEPFPWLDPTPLPRIPPRLAGMIDIASRQITPEESMKLAERIGDLPLVEKLRSAIERRNEPEEKELREIQSELEWEQGEAAKDYAEQMGRDIFERTGIHPTYDDMEGLFFEAVGRNPITDAQIEARFAQRRAAEELELQRQAVEEEAITPEKLPRPEPPTEVVPQVPEPEPPPPPAAPEKPVPPGPPEKRVQPYAPEGPTPAAPVEEVKPVTEAAAKEIGVTPAEKPTSAAEAVRRKTVKVSGLDAAAAEATQRRAERRKRLGPALERGALFPKDKPIPTEEVIEDFKDQAILAAKAMKDTGQSVSKWLRRLRVDDPRSYEFIAPFRDKFENEVTGLLQQGRDPIPPSAQEIEEMKKASEEFRTNPFIPPSEAKAWLKTLKKRAGTPLTSPEVEDRPANRKRLDLEKEGKTFETLPKVEDYVERVRRLFEENRDRAEDDAFWYEDALEPFVRRWGPVEGKKRFLAALFANQNIDPVGAVDNSVLAWEILNEAPLYKKPGLAEEKLYEILKGKPVEHKGRKIWDFADAGLGIESRSLFGNAPEAGQPSPGDVWWARVSGLIDAKYIRKLAKAFPERAKELRRLRIDVAEKPDGTLNRLSDGQYEYTSRFANEAAKLLNERRVGGLEWNAARAMAVGWSDVQRVVGEEPVHPKQFLPEYRIAFEVAPAKDSEAHKLYGDRIKRLSPEGQLRVMDRVGQTIVDAAVDGARVEPGDLTRGYGGYEGDLNAAGFFRGIMSRIGVQNSADLLQYYGEQNEVYGGRRLSEGKTPSLIVYQPQGNQLAKPEVYRRIWEKLKRFDPAFAEGFQPGDFTIEGKRVPGMEFFLFGKLGELAGDRGRVEKAFADALQGEGFGVEFDFGRNKTYGTPRQNWEADPRGEGILSRLRERGFLQEQLDAFRSHKERIREALLDAIAAEESGKPVEGAVRTEAEPIPPTPERARTISEWIDAEALEAKRRKEARSRGRLAEAGFLGFGGRPPRELARRLKESGITEEDLEAGRIIRDESILAAKWILEKGRSVKRYWEDLETQDPKWSKFISPYRQEIERQIAIQLPVYKLAGRFSGVQDEIEKMAGTVESLSAQIERTGTLPKEEREKFAALERATTTEGEVRKLRFSIEDVEAVQSGLVTLADRIKGFRDELSSFTGSPDQKDILEKTLGIYDKALRAKALEWGALRLAAGRTLHVWNRPTSILNDTAAILKEAGVKMRDLPELAANLPILTQIAQDIATLSRRGLSGEEVATISKRLVKNFGRFNRYQYIRLTSFMLDIGSDLTHGLVAGPGSVGRIAGHDLVHLFKQARAGEAPSFPMTRAAFRVMWERYYPGNGWKPKPLHPDIEEGLEKTALGGEVSKEMGWGIMTTREDLADKILDTVTGASIEVKSLADTFFGRLAAHAVLYREAYKAAEAKKLTGTEYKEFVEDFVNDPPGPAKTMAIEEGRKAKFNRELSRFEKMMAGSEVTAWTLEPFIRFGFQATRAFGEMLGIDPGMAKKIATKGGRSQLTAEEIGEWIGKAATGWGALALLSSWKDDEGRSWYDRWDPKRQAIVWDDGSVQPIYGWYPLTLALPLVALLRGDGDKFVEGLAGVEIPGMRTISWGLGNTDAPGGIITPLLTDWLRAKEKNDFRTFDRRLDDMMTGLIPGNQFLAMFKILLDSKMRRGPMRNLPGLSFLAPEAVEETTGEAPETRQTVFGALPEIPKAGVTFPFRIEVPGPIRRVLNRIDLNLPLKERFQPVRGPRTPVMDVPFAQIPQDLRDEWLRYYGAEFKKRMTPRLDRLNSLAEHGKAGSMQAAKIIRKLQSGSRRVASGQLLQKHRDRLAELKAEQVEMREKEEAEEEE